MKTKYKREGVIEATLADYVQNELHVTKIDRKFIQEFAHFNNMDSDYDAIEIITNDAELCSLVHRVILDYKQFLKDRGYQITKTD
jgi:hypothetical protein